MDNSLFSEEIWDATIEESQENKGPVTVLGVEFANDDERRAYFREELRKKLPELRYIEGFPIGEDDDIINLSDPPYYTACPNPWLNDLIKDWENEKVQLESEGKRSGDFEVDDPYASDVLGIKNDSVYRSLSYHTKVPQAIVMNYLFHYTQPGDIVYDGFCGTGMTGLACQSCENPSEELIDKVKSISQTSKGRRHCICGDLSPFAISMAYNLNTPIQSKQVEVELNKIYKSLQEEIGWMYQTKHINGDLGEINCVIYSDIMICPQCGELINLWESTVDIKNKKLLNKITCPHCGSEQAVSSLKKAMETVYDDSLQRTIERNVSKPIRVVYTYKNKRYEKDFDSYDQEILDKIETYKLDAWYPVLRMPEGGETRRNDKDGVTHTHHFYTKRNLVALSLFLKKIMSSKCYSKLNYLFTGMIIRSTIMNRVHFTKYLSGKTDWDAGHLKGTMYVPSYKVESSVMAQVRNKWQRYQKAAPYLPSKYDNAVMISSATSSGIANDSIDYIFVDPPFGANITYSELNFLEEAWLKIITSKTEEAIEDPYQSKDLTYYLAIMSSCFKEFYRILKPNKWMTIEFSNTNASVWNAIQLAITKAGFVVANVASLNKGQGGMRSVTTTTAVKQDLAISCYKPSKKIQNITTDVDSVWEFIDEHLKHLPVTIIEDGKCQQIIERDKRILYDRLISYYIQRGYPVPIDAIEFQKGLNERFIVRDGMYFNATQASEYDEKKKSAPEFIPMGLIVSNEADGIEWLRNRLRVHGPQTYQQIQPEWMQAINGLRKNDILPELKDLLYENFIEEADGKWRLPNVQDDVDKAALRTKALLKEFKIYVEVAQKPKAKLKEVRVEAVRAGFKQCYIDKDFQTIVTVGDKIPQNLLEEDENLIQFYDIAMNHV